MFSLYFYAFLVLLIVSGSGVALYYLSDSIIKLEEKKDHTKINVCPPGVVRDDCLPYEEVIEEEELIKPVMYDSRDEREIRREIEMENEYIRNLNRKIEEMNAQIKN